jgi:hypothetical protein
VLSGLAITGNFCPNIRSKELERNWLAGGALCMQDALEKELVQVKPLILGVLKTPVEKVITIDINDCFQSTFPGLEMKKPPRRRFFRPKQQPTEWPCKG